MPFRLSRVDALTFVPDGERLEVALARTTYLGVGAHQDDLELMAPEAILECFGHADRWFTGVIVSDGANGPRGAAYAGYDAARMIALRSREQNKAATLGEYSLQLQLLHPSALVKSPSSGPVTDDLERILLATRPSRVYTHALTDRHDTHVAVTLRVIEACRRLPLECRPERLIGCEVWRDLDWLVEADRVSMPLTGEHLQLSLLGVFDSQLAGGKRYDLAALGRRRAHATFSESHDVDRSSSMALGMDLTPLLAGGSPAELVDGMLLRFQEDVRERMARLSRR